MRENRDWPTKGEMRVMQVLQNNPKGCYGLQIVDEAKKDDELKISKGSIYVLLNRLEDKGFVQSKQPKADPDYPGLPRPIYTLTAEGAKVLRTAGVIGLLPARA